MNFEDEPVPGYPLPILPGHTSPGRLERVLRAGQFAVTSELAPPDSADPEEVYQRAGCLIDTWTPSTRQTAVERTVTCRAWRCVRS